MKLDAKSPKKKPSSRNQPLKDFKSLNVNEAQKSFAQLLQKNQNINSNHNIKHFQQFNEDSSDSETPSVILRNNKIPVRAQSQQA